MARRSRKQPSSKRIVSFWFAVITVSLILACLGFMGGKYWVGSLIKRGKIDTGAPKITVRTTDGKTQTETVENADTSAPPSQAEVKVRERAATDAERSELEQRYPQDAAQLNRQEQSNGMRPDESVGSDQQPVPSGEAVAGAGQAQSPGMYSVSAGSYGDPSNAEREVSRLIAKGYSPYVVKVTRSGHILHRVIVATYPDREDANRLRDKLRKDGATASVSSE